LTRCGNDKLGGEFRQQIINGVSDKDIRASWEPGMLQYKEMRKEYLLYD